MNEYMILSHNDLDGVSCNLILGVEYSFDIEINTNYNDIIYNLRTIETYVTPHTKKIFITDLNFSKEDFKELIMFSQRHKEIAFIFIDHHIYENNILEKIGKINNIEIIHNIKKSATLLCYDYILKNTTKIKTFNDEGLKYIKKYAQYVNAYDIWLKETPLFKVGWMLNTVFWEIKAKSFRYHIKKNNFEIPKNFIDMYKGIVDSKNKMYNDLKGKNLIITDEENSIFLAFSDNYKAFFQIDFPEYDIHILPYQSSNNISIRFNENVPNSRELRDKILEYANSFEMCISCGGHDFAFGITNNKDAPKEKLFELLDGIDNIIKEHKNCKKS